MNIDECLEYILNFDENKLFNTKQDNDYTNKEAYKEEIRDAKEHFRQYLKREFGSFRTIDAFNYCEMYLTDTPHQALAEYMMYALKNIKIHKTEQFLNFVVEQLKEVDVLESNKELEDE